MVKTHKKNITNRGFGGGRVFEGNLKQTDTEEATEVPTSAARAAQEV